MRSSSLTALLFVLAPSVVNAEVMDKEIAFPVVIGLAVATLGAGFMAARYKPVLLWLVLPAFCLLWLGQLTELLDPHVGSAIAREAGTVYVALSWGGVASLIVGPILGFVLHPAAAPRRR